MQFKKAAQNDIKDLVALRIEYLLEDYGKISDDKMLVISENLPTYFTNHLNKDLFVFVCKENGVIIGCSFLYVSEKPSNPTFVNGKTGTILNVYTKPQFRKKGIASQLIKMLLQESKEMNLDFVELKATESGYNLYKSLGFEDVISKYHNMKFIINHRNQL